MVGLMAFVLMESSRVVVAATAIDNRRILSPEASLFPLG